MWQTNTNNAWNLIVRRIFSIIFYKLQRPPNSRPLKESLWAFSASTESQNSFNVHKKRALSKNGTDFYETKPPLFVTETFKDLRVYTIKTNENQKVKINTPFRFSVVLP